MIRTQHLTEVERLLGIALQLQHLSCPGEAKTVIGEVMALLSAGIETPAQKLEKFDEIALRLQGLKRIKDELEAVSFPVPKILKEELAKPHNAQRPYEIALAMTSYEKDALEARFAKERGTQYPLDLSDWCRTTLLAACPAQADANAIDFRGGGKKRGRLNDTVCIHTFFDDHEMARFAAGHEASKWADWTRSGFARSIFFGDPA